MSSEPIDAPPTEQQKNIHAFMLAYQEEHGAPPTLREIGAYIGASSSNGVTDHLKLMKRRGMVRHYPHRPRGWVPVRTTP